MGKDRYVFFCFYDMQRTHIVLFYCHLPGILFHTKQNVGDQGHAYDSS